MKKNTLINESLSYNCEDSKVILVGTSEYTSEEINNLDNVNGNLKALKEIFCNPDLFGFNEASVIILNSVQSSEFRNTLHKIVKNTNDTIFFYYSGHGIYSNDKLYFTFKDTEPEYLISTAVEFEEVEKILKDNYNLQRKFVIIDSCFSGKVTDMMGDYNSLFNANLNQLKGSYILASSPSNRPSKSLPGKGITEFTESLVYVLKTGVDKRYRYIWDEVLFNAVDIHLKEKTNYQNDIYRPTQKKNFNGNFNISKNPQFSIEHVYNALTKEEIKPSIDFFSLRKLGNSLIDFINSKNESKKLNEQLKLYKAQYEEALYYRKNITDSIYYASIIQRRLFPDDNLLKTYFKDWFIYLKPRDIVSGDFFWFAEQDEKIIVVTSDSTGYGVPGAFLSLIGVNLLNEILRKNINISSDNILNEFKRLFLLSMKQSQDQYYDGYDMSICVVNKKNKTIEFSGVYNPLYYFQNNDFYEIKADRISINGRNEDLHIEFKKTVINYSDGDTFYLFSDGYTDQFGGTELKKFKSSRFKDILIEIQPSIMDEQKRIIGSIHDNWRNENEQSDDILVFGFKL
ncbi:MAG: hypothetical protein A2X08_12545 [Bacteroidetes bacterium GWA2_32_17]|nr:MAG: hypothetical protein A2X08_12545 [Bacteroidetes bacterium GWA2_32_17]